MANWWNIMNIDRQVKCGRLTILNRLLTMVGVGNFTMVSIVTHTMRKLFAKCVIMNIKKLGLVGYLFLPSSKSLNGKGWTNCGPRSSVIDIKKANGFWDNYIEK